MENRQRLYFLDGLRGWAAVSVLLLHTFNLWLIAPEALRARGYADYVWIINNSPLTFISDGRLGVFVFFVISGAALSYPILISPAPMRTLAEMVGWRYPRLTIPIAVSSFAAFLLVSAGWMSNRKAAPAGPSDWLAFPYGPEQVDLVPFILWRVYTYIPSDQSWNMILWTMRIEFIGSFLLFAGLFAVRHCTARVSLAAAATIGSLNTYYCGFFAGYLIAEMLVSTKWASHRLAPYIGMTLVGFVCIASIYKTKLIGHSLVGNNVLAIALVTGVVVWSSAQRILSCRFSRWLGRISFSLYLVHILVICSLGSALYLALEPRIGFPMTIGVVGLTTIAASVACAMMFERAVDRTILVSVKEWIRKGFASFSGERPSLAPER